MLAEVKVSGQGERFELLSLQGAVAFMDGKMAVSVTHFEKAAAIAPLREGDSFTMAMALVKLGDDKRARVVLTDLAQAHPRRPLYLYWLGRLDYDQRRYEEAIQKLQQASELDSKSARIWDSLGLAFDMQGRMEKALAAFRKAVDLNRTETHPSPWPPHNLGFLLLRMDQPQQAETALRESLRYNSNLAQSHYHLGRALEKEGRDSEAIEEYRSAVRSDTTSTDACYSLAMLYRKLHRDSDANTMFAEYKKRRQTPTVQ
jgi:tetratricopeptide (TPR) repeat protein